MTFTERMQRARGEMSCETAAALIRPLLHPSQIVSSATVRRLEERPEDKADPVLVWALARVYGVPVKRLSPSAAAWLSLHFGDPDTSRRRSQISSYLDVASVA